MITVNLLPGKRPEQEEVHLGWQIAGAIAILFLLVGIFFNSGKALAVGLVLGMAVGGALYGDSPGSDDGSDAPDDGSRI